MPRRHAVNAKPQALPGTPDTVAPGPHPQRHPRRECRGKTAAPTCRSRWPTIAALLCLGWSAALAQPPADSDLWLTLHGDRQDRERNLVEVRPEPTTLDQRVVLDLRVSREHMRTSFRGQKYRSYYAKAVVDCTGHKAWYLWLTYYSEPQWTGTIAAREEYVEGQAPVLFKDVPGEPYKRMIAAACKVRG